MRWRRTREAGWKKSAAINAFGGTVTGVVLVVVILTKFNKGAWIIILATPLVMLLMRAVYNHYTYLNEQLAHPERKPLDRRPGNAHFVILVRTVDAATARAVGFARATRSSDISAVTFDAANHSAWNRLAPNIPLGTLPSRGHESLLTHLRRRRASLPRNDFLTVITPEVLVSKGWYEIIRRPGLHRLKAKLIKEPDIQVLDIPVLAADIVPGKDDSHEPARNYVVVLISAVHNAVLEAIEYAETLRPTNIRAVSFGLEPEETERLGDQWLEARVPHPLEIEGSPYRDLGDSVTRYVRELGPDGVNRVVTVVIPEFIVSKGRHQLLHGQTALVIKRRLLFEKGVVVVSVPYHL
jgi:hypothetical protein